MAVYLSPVGGAAAQFFDDNGQILTGGKLYTYLAGTTTPATTYTTSSGNVASSNPIILNAAGRVSGGGEIWLADGTSYKFTLKDSNDVQIAVWDNIVGINVFDPITSANISYNEGGASAVTRTVQSKLQEWVSVKDFGAVGDGSTDDTDAITAAINSVNNTAPAQYNLVSLYFPAGKYMVRSNVLPAIKGNVYGPDATIEATIASTNTSAILTVDYTTTVGQTFILRAINGAGNGELASYYNAGLVIDGADNSTFIINRLYGLDTGIVLAGSINNRHIAQCTFNINAIYNCNKGLNLSAGSIQVETNTFNIEYLSTRDDNSIGIYLVNTTGYVANNTFNINTVESAGTNITTFNLVGATPALIVGNNFNVFNNFAPPTTGNQVLADANIGVNRFNLCNVYLSKIVVQSRQIFNIGTVDLINGRSLVYNDAAPTAASYWNTGDIVLNNSSNINILGWKCTVSGSPGTWESFSGTDLIDYSATSTIIGWASYTTKGIYVRKIGTTVFVNFFIAGVSNSTDTSFTLPYAAKAGNFYFGAYLLQGIDNGSVVSAGANASLDQSLSLVRVSKTTGITVGLWTASGTKQIIGQFFYETT